MVQEEHGYATQQLVWHFMLPNSYMQASNEAFKVLQGITYTMYKCFVGTAIMLVVSGLTVALG